MLEKDSVIKIKDIVINILKSDRVNPAWVQDNPQIYSVNLMPLFFFFFSFQIRTFQLEDSQDCSRDFVEIREENATGHLLGRYCGNTLPLNYSSIVAQSLWIRFVSDGSGSGTGFQATFAKSKLVLC